MREEETDSLEHVAFFYQDKITCCSDSWTNKIHTIDQALLYIKFLFFRE
jgi:hypothetical protein